MGYVHQDLKLDNVLIAHNGHTKLVDFGVAGQLENGKVVKVKYNLYIYMIICDPPEKRCLCEA